MLRKELQNHLLVYTSSINHEIRQFHVVVVQRRPRNVQKSVMHVQSCYFANHNLLFFMFSSSKLKLPNLVYRTSVTV